MQEINEYSKEFHLKLTKIINGLDPFYIANDDPLEYFYSVNNAVYSYANGNSLIESIESSLSESFDEDFKFTQEQKHYINENIQEKFEFI